ncbi:MAG TPA: O-antigen ligase family protein [Actinomycetes bacterium]|nr:O-antigen ligase family protein [Actinomycetes bacterium]
MTVTLQRPPGVSPPHAGPGPAGGPAGRRPLPFSVILLLPAVAFLPLLIPHGPSNTAPVDLLIMLYLVAATIGWVAPRRPMSFPLAAVTGFIVLVSLIGVGMSQFAGVGRTAVLIDLYLYVFFLAAVNDLRHDRWALGVVLATWAFTALVWAALANGITFHFLPDSLARLILSNSRALNRASATADNPNLAASYFLVSLFVLAASPRPRTRWLRWLAGGWLILAIYSTGSVAGLVGLFTGIGAALGSFLVRRAGSTARQTQVVVALMLIVVAVGAGAIVRTVATRSVLSDVATISAEQKQGGVFQNSLGRSNRSLNGRLTLWTQGLDKSFGRGNELFGVGAGEAKYTVDYKSLHNDILAYLVERGIIALFALAALYWLVFREASRLLGPRGPTGLHVLGAAVFANFAFSMTHQTLHFRHVWLLFALIWAATSLSSEEERG